MFMRSPELATGVKLVGELVFFSLRSLAINILRCVISCSSYSLIKHKFLSANIYPLQDCAGAILYSTEKAVEVALEGMQCLGGNGYINGGFLPPVVPKIDFTFLVTI
jgi:hypothetical protein